MACMAAVVWPKRPSHPYNAGTEQRRVFTDQAETVRGAGGGLLFVIRGGNASKHLEYDPVRAALLPLADLAGDGSVQGVRRVGGVEAAAAVDDGVNQPRRHRGNVSGHQGVGGGRPVGLRWFRGARVVSAVLVAVVVVVVVGVGWFLTCGTVEASPNLPCRGSAYFF